MKAFILTILLFTSISNVLSKNFESKDVAVKYYNTLGDKYRAKGKNQKALGYYETALTYNPYNYEANMKAAIVSRAFNNYANMIYYFEQLFTYSDESYQSSGNLGAVYAELGYDNEAFMYLEKTLDENPYYAFALNNMGATLMRYDKYNEARIYLLKANEQNPKMPDPLHNLGNSYYENNQLDSALLYYNKAIEANPNFDKALISKALTLKKIGADPREYKRICHKLIKQCNRILKNQPNNYDAIKIRSSVYYILGNKSAMDKDMNIKLQELNKLIELYPNAYTFIESRGDTYNSLENTEAAIKDYKRVLEINPEYKYIERKIIKLQQQ